MKKNHNNNERGNVIFYILIAIVLLASLTYAVTRNNRANSSKLTSEQARIAAQEIIGYGNDIATAVQKLTLRGCLESEISFFSSTIFELNEYQSTPEVRDECKVFHEKGGDINYVKPNEGWLNIAQNGHSLYGLWRFSAKTAVNGIGTDGVDDENAELFIILPFVSNEICENINKNLGIGNNIPTDDFFWSTAFKDNNYGVSSTVDEASLVNRTSACQGSNIFWQILIAR